MDALMFAVALLPIIWLIVALLVLKWPAWKAAIGALALGAGLGGFVWQLPADQVFTAGLEGFLQALWPIVIVIIAAIFMYRLCVATGAMDRIISMITSISSDRRILALLLAWCFGGFMEGIAGFGTAVAIPAGMLAGLGFNPITAVLICLVANGVPTPFGSIGIPTATLSNMIGHDLTRMAWVEMVQLAPFYLITPFLVVFIAGGVTRADGSRPGIIERFRGVTLVTLVSALSFVTASCLVAAFVGPGLVVVVGSITALITTALMSAWVEKRGKLGSSFRMEVKAAPKLTVGQALQSWCCFIILFVLLIGTSRLFPNVQSMLSVFATSAQIYTGENPATLTFNWVNTPGVWILIAALAGGAIQGARPRQMAEVMGATLKQMAPTIITLLCVLSCAKIMSYSGMITSIATFCVALLGGGYLLIAPVFGALGTFVTGSGTLSCVLFGHVQLEAASAIGVDPYWMAALNSLGTAAGKMLSLQTISIGLAAVEIRGKESELFKKVAPYGLGFLVLMSIWALAGWTCGEAFGIANWIS